MGFRPDRTILDITFEGSDLEGLHLQARSVSVRTYNELTALMLATGATDAETGRLRRDADRRLFDAFLGALVSWDMEDPGTGQPVPASREGVDLIESNHLTRIMTGWYVALTSVPPPLPPTSNGSRPSERELSIPMAPLSTSPPS